MFKKKRLIILDSNSIIHRAFYALPLLKTKKGELVNAVYGFFLVFFKAIKEFQPDYIAACFDFPAPTFRHKEYKEYKITRPPTPKDLALQIPKIKEILKAFNVPIFEKEGFEADDIIGTISERFQGEKIILSGDLDTLQLVDKNTKIYLLKTGVKNTILYDEKLVGEKYQGLKPEQIVDFKALKGDPSDNIPGVEGIGEKTAIDLIQKFNNLEGVYQNLEKIKPKLREMLIQQKEKAFFSKMLAKIKRDVPIDFNLEKCEWGKYQKEKIAQIFRELEFKTLIKRLEEINGGLKNENLKLWQN